MDRIGGDECIEVESCQIGVETAIDVRAAGPKRNEVRRRERTKRASREARKHFNMCIGIRDCRGDQV